MNVTIEQVKNGLSAYIDSEIAPMLEGWERIGFCSAAVLILRKLPLIFDQYKNNNFVKMLGVIDEKDNIDLDALRDAVASYLKEEHIDIPIIKRRMKVTGKDLDKLYNMIKEA